MSHFQIKSSHESRCLFLSFFYPEGSRSSLSGEKGYIVNGNCFFVWKKSASTITFLVGDDEAPEGSQFQKANDIFHDQSSLADIAKALNDTQIKLQYCLLEASPERIYAVDEDALAQIVPRRLQRNIRADSSRSSHYALVRLLSMGHSPAIVASQGTFILPFHAGLPASVLQGARPEIQNHELEEEAVLILHSEPGEELAGRSLREMHEMLAANSETPDAIPEMPALLIAMLYFREKK